MYIPERKSIGGPEGNRMTIKDKVSSLKGEGRK